jgi:hypothetical protein
MTVASIEPPKLNSIDKETVLFGSIYISWTKIENSTAYHLFRDYEPITDVRGWVPYAIIDNGNTFYNDENYDNGSTYFYAVKAVNALRQESPLSNPQQVKVNLPAHLVVDLDNVEVAAYYESKKPISLDNKIWDLARLQLILELSFPKRTLEYLKIKVKSIKRDLPEFKGLFIEPTEEEIRHRAQQIFNEKLDQMDINWRVSEKELVFNKLEELREYEYDRIRV